MASIPAGDGGFDIQAQSTSTAAISGIAGDKDARTGDREAGIKPIFDKDRVGNDINAQITITGEFGKQAGQTIGDYATTQLRKAATLRQQAEQESDPARRQALNADADKLEQTWGEGKPGRLLAHGIVGALTGNAAGAAGAVSSQTLMPRLNEALAEADLPEPLKQALVQAAGMSVGAIAGGTSGAATGHNATTNNLLLHSQEIDLLIYTAQCKQSPGSKACAQQQALEELRAKSYYGSVDPQTAKLTAAGDMAGANSLYQAQRPHFSKDYEELAVALQNRTKDITDERRRNQIYAQFQQTASALAEIQRQVQEQQARDAQQAKDSAGALGVVRGVKDVAVETATGMVQAPAALKHHFENGGTVNELLAASLQDTGKNLTTLGDCGHATARECTKASLELMGGIASIKSIKGATKPAANAAAKESVLAKYIPAEPVRVTDAHSVDTIKLGTWFGDGNRNTIKTVAKGGVDLQTDIKAINAGQGVLRTDGKILAPSGRVWQKHPPPSSTVFPVEGPGLIGLSQAEFRIYQRMLESNGLEGNALKAFEGQIKSGNQGLSNNSRQKLIDLYNSRGR